LYNVDGEKKHFVAWYLVCSSGLVVDRIYAFAHYDHSIGQLYACFSLLTAIGWFYAFAHYDHSIGQLYACFSLLTAIGCHPPSTKI
jgi:hypothetical protein